MGQKDTTQPHNTGEWFAGYRQGVDAGRRDVLHLLDVLLGKGEFGSWVLSQLLIRLEGG